MQPFSASVTATKATVFTGTGRISGFVILNNAAAITYIQVFDALAANVTVGTTAPTYVIPLPASGAVTMPTADIPRNALTFTLGCVIASCTTRTGSSTATSDVLLWVDQVI